MLLRNKLAIAALVCANVAYSQTSNLLFNSTATSTSYDVQNSNTPSGLSMGINGTGEAYINQQELLPLTLHTGNVERVHIAPSGEVGINEGVPQAQLDIGGNLRIQNVTLDPAPLKYLTLDPMGMVQYADATNGPGGNFWALQGNSGTDANINYCGTIDTKDFALGTDNTQRMLVLKNGQVQVGGIANFFQNDVNPSSNNPGSGRLSVYGNSAFGTVQARGIFELTLPGHSIICGSDNIGASGTIRMGFTGVNGVFTNTGQWHENTPGDDLFIISRAGNIEKTALSIDGDGDLKVGFFNILDLTPPNQLPGGAKTPEVDLTVTGQVGIGIDADPFAELVGGQNGTYALKVNGSTWSLNGTYVTSDATLKEDIGNLENGIDLINALRPVTYHFSKSAAAEHNLNLGDKLEYGLLAQELELVIPELVQTNALGIKAVRYESLIPVLIAAVQDQQAQIDELKLLAGARADGSTLAKEEATFDSNVELGQNMPNPATYNTIINFDVPSDYANLSFEVRDSAGKLVFMRPLSVSEGQVDFSIQGFGSGVYFYSIISNNQILATKKMIVQ